MQAWVWIVVAVAGLGGLILTAGFLLPKLLRLFGVAGRLAKLLTQLEGINLTDSLPKRPSSQLGDDPQSHLSKRKDLLQAKRKLKQARERRLVARVLKR
jgi:hypothetical protein